MLVLGLKNGINASLAVLLLYTDLRNHTRSIPNFRFRESILQDYNDLLQINPNTCSRIRIQYSKSQRNRARLYDVTENEESKQNGWELESFVHCRRCEAAEQYGQICVLRKDKIKSLRVKCPLSSLRTGNLSVQWRWEVRLCTDTT